MNESIKQLIVGAILALAGAIVGGTLVMWTTAEVRDQRSEAGRQKTGINFQPAASSGQLPVFGGQRLQPNPVMTIPPRVPGTTNASKRLVTSSPTPAISFDQFQKAQELPEVKNAREEFMEAQKRYSEAMKKAMGQAAIKNEK
jgi:hypothetical protein